MNMPRSFATLRQLTHRAFFFLFLLAAGCNQDPIFDYISGETAPTAAKIQGVSSKIVGVKTGAGTEKLFLANGRLWEYAPPEPGLSWEGVSGLEGNVRDVASSDGVLYALTIDNSSSGLWQRQDDGTWRRVDPPPEYGFIQNIFGAGDALFATVGKRIGGNDYKLCYKNKTGPFSILVDANGATLEGALLTGAGNVGSDYYLAGKDKGIYKVSVAGSTATAELIATPSIPTNVVGLLQAEKDFIIGISQDGFLLYIDASGIKVEDTSLGRNYSGALALMDSPEPQDGFDKLLLLGHKGGPLYQQGYMELRFKSSDKTHLAQQIPGEEQPSSISDYRQYDSSLRRYPVTALWVLPKSGEDTHSVIFAATSNEGLYSYRSRSGKWQWNHEE
jgi:hypothetical protein